MNAQKVLWGSLLITLVGSYGCNGKNESNKRSQDATSQPTETISTKKEDVSFNFSLPRHFEEEATQEEPQVEQGEITVSESGIADQFMDFFFAKYIKVSCSDESFIDFFNIKNKKLRGILEVSLVQVQYDDQQTDYYDEREEHKSEHYIEEDEDGVKYESYDYEDLLEEDEVQNVTWNYLETISVPYVCNGAATIKIENLELDTNYRVDAWLYSKHQRLKYTGSTDDFNSESGSLQLVMQKRASDVNIEVVFEKGRKPRN